MTCMLIGDPRSRAGGRLTGAGFGPSGAMLLQPATASTAHAAASAVAENRQRAARGLAWHVPGPP